MLTTKVLNKKEREAIFKLFLNKNKIKFTEIERSLNIKSNKLAYHLNKLQKEGLLEKKRDYYNLTKNAEKYIPIFSNITGENLSPLAVILVAVVNKDKILLIKRNNRPYKNHWCLIGGKMQFGESFKQSSLRLVNEKSGIDSKFISINSVLHETVKSEDKVKHDFILFFTKVYSDYFKYTESKY